MFKHTVAYVDFNGTERNEELYFHLSTPEVVRLEAEIGKTMGDYVKELTTNQDMKNLLDFLEKVLLSSYGRKTSDGRSFHKSKELREEFEYSNAYAEVFEQLLSNNDLARKFGESVADNGRAKKNVVEPTVVNN
jgi:hypothetical protein